MTWILLRGLTRETGHWGSFCTDLSAAVGSERIVLLDLPGNGTHHQRRSPVTVQRIVEACRFEIERRMVRGPFDILALSMGAMVAVAWADRYPDELRRCVLLNTSLRPYAPFHRRLRPESYASLLGALVAGDPYVREQNVLRLTSGNAAARAHVIEDWVAIGRAHPVTRANALRQLFAAAWYRAPPRRPRCDLLLLASTHDCLVDVRCSRAIARAWQVPLLEHPSAGHDLPLDDPRWVAEQVRVWINAPP